MTMIRSLLYIIFIITILVVISACDSSESNQSDYRHQNNSSPKSMETPKSKEERFREICGYEMPEVGDVIYYNTNYPVIFEDDFDYRHTFSLNVFDPETNSENRQNCKMFKTTINDGSF